MHVSQPVRLTQLGLTSSSVQLLSIPSNAVTIKVANFHSGIPVTRGKCPYRLASPKLISVTRVPLVEPVNSYYMVIFPKLSSVIAI